MTSREAHAAAQRRYVERHNSPPTGQPDPTSDLARYATSAYEAAMKLGHRLEGWTRDDYAEMAASCRVCGRWATVYSRPEGRDLPMMGQALSEACKERVWIR
jgi:hypothetical protein